MYVPPPHRSKGAFKKLYQLVKAEAEKAGAAGLRLYADTDNERAHTVVSILTEQNCCHTAYPQLLHLMRADKSAVMHGHLARCQSTKQPLQDCTILLMVMVAVL